MKNRIPTPGKEGRVKITQDNGQIIEGKLEMHDDPIESGTPFAVETMLQNETAEFIGLTPDAVPDDAFRAISPQIGDFKFTLRTDLGENWLLCNGDQFDSQKYPLLDRLLPWDNNIKKEVLAPNNYPDLLPRAMCASKDKVAFVLIWNGRDRIDVNYTIPPASEMALAENKQVSASDVESVSGMACTHDGDAWIITAKCTGNKMAIFYATDIAGAWTRRDIDTASGITNVVYDGTNFCFGVRYTSTYGGRNGIDIVTVSPQNMAQNAIKTTIISEEAFTSGPYLQYVNGIYVFSGELNEAPALWYSNLPNENWQKGGPFDIPPSQSGNYPADTCSGVAYSRGKWFAFFARTPGDGYIIQASDVSFNDATKYTETSNSHNVVCQISDSIAVAFCNSRSLSVAAIVSLTGDAYVHEEDYVVYVSSCAGFNGVPILGQGQYNYSPRMTFLYKKLPEQSTYDQAGHQYIKAK